MASASSATRFACLAAINFMIDISASGMRPRDVAAWMRMTR